MHKVTNGEYLYLACLSLKIMKIIIYEILISIIN